MPHPRRPPPPISSPVVVAAIDKIPNFRSLLEQLTRLPKGFDHPTFDIFRCIGCGVVCWIAQKDE